MRTTPVTLTTREAAHDLTLADAAAFSFYATKNITTGEGGMLVVRDPRAADRARRPLRPWDRSQPMNAVCLRFYTLEKRKLHGMLVHDWLLQQAERARKRRAGGEFGRCEHSAAAIGDRQRLAQIRAERF